MKNKEFQTSNVILLSFSHFVHDIYTSFLAPLLPLIIENLSLSLGQAGLLSAILQLPSLFNPVIGILADRKGLARWFVILAPTMTAIPMSLLGAASSYRVLLVLLFIAGISVAFYHVPAPVLISRASGMKKGRGMSFYMTGGEAARTIGPLIAVAIVSLVGLESFYFVVIFAVLTSVMLYFKLEKIAPPEKKITNISLFSVVKEMKPILVPLSGILTARALMHSALAVFLPVFIVKETGNLWFAGAALAFYEVFGVAGVLCSGILSDRIGRKKILFVALITAPVTLSLFVITSGFISFLMLIATGFALLSSSPVMLAIVQEHAPENPAAANGLYMMVSFAVRSITIVLVGVIGDFAGLENMFLICALAGFGAIPFIIKLEDTLGKEA
ncbi:MAG: MFS transporter [Thermodesulfobacteriota bacterium]|nr:MFS transporter [Thermodesulfobacteriota bacterium]